MKFVSLLIAITIISSSASAQTRHGTSQKRTVAHGQQTAKGRKAKLQADLPAIKNDGVITLTDETAHKAKWTFEEMLQRRLEIDAEDAAKRQQKD